MKERVHNKMEISNSNRQN